MQKTIHLRWLRLKRQTRLSGPRAAQRRNAAWAPLPIFTEIAPEPTGPIGHPRSVLS